MAQTFLEKMLEEEMYIASILKDVKPIVITPRQEQDFRNAVTCHICEDELGADRVRDHDHLTGEYQGAAHNECNLNFKYAKENEKKSSPMIYLSSFTIYEVMMVTS